MGPKSNNFSVKKLQADEVYEFKIALDLAVDKYKGSHKNAFH